MTAGKGDGYVADPSCIPSWAVVEKPQSDPWVVSWGINLDQGAGTGEQAVPTYFMDPGITVKGDFPVEDPAERSQAHSGSG